MKIYCSRDYSQDYITYNLDRFVGKDAWILVNIGTTKFRGRPISSLDHVYDCTIKLISVTDNSYKFYKVIREYDPQTKQVIPSLDLSLDKVYTARKNTVHVIDPFTTYTTEEIFDDFAEYGPEDIDDDYEE